jgi:peroxiredoxin
MEELPYMEEVYSNWTGATNLEVIAVNVGDHVLEVHDVIDPYNFSFTILLDTEKSVSGSYGAASAVPITYLIDPEGIIREVKIGSFDTLNELEETLDSYDW